mgnify:FL=1|jgi:hypothetical protein
MADNGWISIHRKTMSHWIWGYKPFSYGQAWLDILMECNHAEKKQLIKGQLVSTKRGQSSNSIKTWATRFGWSVSATRHFLGLLVKDEMLRLDNIRITTILTVCNYNTYQGGTIAEDSQKDLRPISDQSQTNTNNNINNLNKDTLSKKFEELWYIYPYKQKKQPALLRFENMQPSEGLIGEMLDALKIQVKSGEFAEQYKKKNLLLETWLKDMRWADEVAPKEEEGF